MSSAVEIRALVVTQDTGLATTFAQISKEFGIDSHGVSSPSGLRAELGTAKYEALLIDYGTVPQSVSILNSFRESSSNRNAVVLAVVGDADSRQRAREQGAMFLLERPLRREETRRVLHAAYGLMTRERRRYFRLAVELPVQLVRENGQEVACKTINVSSNGLAVHTPSPFEAGEKLHMSLTLPGAKASLRARSTVMWDDKHGKAGLSMECANPQMQIELDSWLDGNFSKVLAKPH